MGGHLSYHVILIFDPLILNICSVRRPIGCDMIELRTRFLVKSNKLQLSYSDIKIENWWTVPTMDDFTISGFQSLHCLRGPITHPHTKFQQNRYTRLIYFREPPTIQCLSEVNIGRTTSNLIRTFQHDRRMLGWIIQLLTIRSTLTPGFQRGAILDRLFLRVGERPTLNFERG